MEPLVSVIVPVYRTEIKYLRGCIESVLSQPGVDLELLLVNDGSPDGCGDVCREYAEKDPRVRYFYQENRGVSVARNNGLDHAEGTYVLFADADDFLSENVLSGLVQSMESREIPADLLLFGYCTSYTNREMRRVLENPAPELFEKNTLQLAVLRGDERLGPVEVGAPWGKLIRRSVIEENHVRYTPGLTKGQDTVFTLHLLQHCDTIAYAPVCGYHYRISGSSVSHRYNPGIVGIMERTLKAYEDFVAAYDKGPDFSRAVAGKYYRVLTGEYLDLYYRNSKNDRSPAENRREYGALLDRSPYRESIAMQEPGTFSLTGRIEYGLLAGRHLTLLWWFRGLLQTARALIVKNYS